MDWLAKKRRRRRKPRRVAKNKYEEQAQESRRENHRLRSCEKKRRYETEEEAYQKGMVSYHCKYCGGWHRGSEPSRKAIQTVRTLTRLKYR